MYTDHVHGNTYTKWLLNFDSQLAIYHCYPWCSQHSLSTTQHVATHII